MELYIDQYDELMIKDTDCTATADDAATKFVGYVRSR